MKRKPSRIQQLRDQGFDLTTVDTFNRTWRPRCSQCEVIVINGVACHESRCPNQPQEHDDADPF